MKKEEMNKPTVRFACGHETEADIDGKIQIGSLVLELDKEEIEEILKEASLQRCDDCQGKGG